jgi:hypothetical protein
MSGIMIRVPVRIVASVFLALAGALVGGTSVADAAPAGHWPAPLGVAPPRIDISVSTATYDCGNQSPIKIVGEDATITLNGSCGEVDISGAANTVNIQTVAIIKATGSSNHITWENGPGGGVPQISNPSGSNDITGPGGFQAPASKG